MAFGDGTAEARVAARYAGIGGQEIAEAQRQADAEKAVRRAARDFRPDRLTGRERRPSAKAVDFLVVLSAERFPNVTEASIREWAAGVDASAVSEKIDWLKTQPKAVNSGTGSKSYDVPAGRYAVTGAQGQTVFLKVDRPETGPFKGRVFVRIQASDELIRTAPSVRDALLAKIEEAGVEAATIRYGRELGVCGRCGRTLTDEESRAAGIGPVCASKGW